MFSISNISNNIYSKPYDNLDSLPDSFDTIESLNADQVSDSLKSPSKPSDNKFLFKSISLETQDYYEDLFEKLKFRIEEIEENLPCVNIRDDCTVKPKAVVIRLGARPRFNTTK
ncbi:hypothetical protein SteCoe_8068 [Stentor coeruleus]|uniref:Uncharacterized protein n=1 Tax=Stentor coeruleus TaxID=5963 RepID=A0A1R2CL10_9CILI|nr:hypothetical protein SteCoe_8068 [Stentor coeruleus]